MPVVSGESTNTPDFGDPAVKNETAQQKLAHKAHVVSVDVGFMKADHDESQLAVNISSSELRATGSTTGRDSGVGIEEIKQLAVSQFIDLDAMTARVDEVKPIGRHPANFRQFILPIEHHRIAFGMMAHPELYGSPYGGGVKENEGIDRRAAINKVQAAGYNTVIALEKEEFPLIKKEWEKDPSKHAYLQHIEDNTAPSIEQLDEIFDKVVEAASADSDVIVYCGAGFGRSGTIAASLVLRDLIHSEYEAGTLSKTQPERTVPIHDVDHQVRLTTPLVAAAIQRTREQDPECGHNLREKNARASLEGPSVEHREQIHALETLELSLREKFGKEGVV